MIYHNSQFQYPGYLHTYCKLQTNYHLCYALNSQKNYVLHYSKDHSIY